MFAAALALLLLSLAAGTLPAVGARIGAAATMFTDTTGYRTAVLTGAAVRRNILGRRRGAPRALRRRVHPRDHRPRRRQLSVYRRRPEDPGLHLRPDERDPRPQPPGDRRDRAKPGRDPRPPVQRHAE